MKERKPETFYAGKNTDEGKWIKDGRRVREKKNVAYMGLSLYERFMLEAGMAGVRGPASAVVGKTWHMAIYMKSS